MVLYVYESINNHKRTSKSRYTLIFVCAPEVRVLGLTRVLLPDQNDLGHGFIEIVLIQIT